MARKYDWEAHLTPWERVNMDRWGAEIETLKAGIKVYQESRDRTRREGVQRARNAILKQERAAR